MRSRLGIFLLALVGCAATRGEVLSRSLAGVDAAEKAFVAYDRAHQGGIVDTSTSYDQGHRTLEAYRSQRDKVATAIVAAYAAIAAASVDTTDDSLRKAAAAMTTVVSALRELGVIPGGKP